MTETLTPQREFTPQDPPPSETKKPNGPTVADVLERAADLLGEFGWEQGCELWSDMQHGPSCILGAIYFAHRDLTGEHGDPYRVGASYLGDPHPPTHWGWNDAPGRTKAEVISALRAAASSARTKE